MNYRLFEYFNDEVAGWSSTIEFHKEQSRALVSKISLVIDHHAAGVDDMQASNGFMDQVMVQLQVLAHIAQQLTTQKQRLDRVSSLPGTRIDKDITHQQELLRARMQTAERTSIRIKYNCISFLYDALRHEEDEARLVSGLELTPARR